MSELDIFPNRPERRFLRRAFNGRTDPIIIADHAFLTYKDAVKYLAAQEPHAREAGLAEIKKAHR